MLYAAICKVFIISLKNQLKKLELCEIIYQIPTHTCIVDVLECKYLLKFRVSIHLGRHTICICIAYCNLPLADSKPFS